jgi:hypothetical protein
MRSSGFAASDFAGLQKTWPGCSKIVDSQKGAEPLASDPRVLGVIPGAGEILLTLRLSLLSPLLARFHFSTFQFLLFFPLIPMPIL